MCINYRERREEAEALVLELTSSGTEAVAIRADISVEAEVARLFQAVDEFGTLKALVDNAGTLETQSRLETLTTARLTRFFRRTSSAHLCVRARRRPSTRHGGAGGAIVNVSSAVSHHPFWMVNLAFSAPLTLS